MSRLRVNSFTISLDGYGAGPDQSLENPLGVGGIALHEWAFATRTFRQMFGQEGGTTDIDDEFAVRGFENIGAWIMGRNMFGPIRGDWPDDVWKGWWGDNPVYHCPVFVLTHYPRPSIVMEGGTTFHFVTDGIHDGIGTCYRSGSRKRHPRRRRRLHHPAILAGRAHRRDASCHLTGLAWQRRTPLCRDRPPNAWLPAQRACPQTERHAYRSQQIEVNKALLQSIRLKEAEPYFNLFPKEDAA